MGDGPIHVLLVEDNAGDAKLIEMMLEESPGVVFELTWLDTLAACLDHLAEREPDVILLDFGLPDSHGLDTLKRVFAHTPHIPTLVVLSGTADESVALEAVQHGAQDYLIKGQVDSALLMRSIRYAIERARAEEALRQAHADLEERVKERTAELAGAVEALHAEIAERKQAEERIRYMAHFDILTGLPNRILLEDRIRQAIRHSQRSRRLAAVLIVDLDFFKHVNDSLGHQVGDQLLQMVAARLQECLREGDSIARLGGDEFVLCLSSLTDASGAGVVAQKVLDSLHQSFVVEEQELPVSASIGISIYPDNGPDVLTLLRKADTAMYHAKESGRGGFRFFTPALDMAAQHRLDLGRRLRQALARNELEVYFQPQVDMVTGAVLSAEALLRWPYGQVQASCAGFISVAEETGLIHSLGEWVLRQACRAAKSWYQEGFTGMRVAVNVSPRQFTEPGLVSTVREILLEERLPASALDLEITEGVLLHAGEDIITTLQHLSNSGIQLSLDDFGTGYSSLAYLLRFPVHALKIDRTFVRDAGSDATAAALVTAIVSLARSLNMKVLAEGVENDRQAAFMLDHGCFTAQGFHYSQAVPAEAFTRILKAGGYAGRAITRPSIVSGRGMS